MRKILPQDTINGKEGRAYVKINGDNEELFFARSVSAQIDYTKSEIKAIGRRMAGHKVMGASGTGSMTLYYLSPIFRRMAMSYVKTGVGFTFDLVVENEDPSSAAGRQVTLLTGCSLNSVVLAKLDGDSEDALDEECEFTFDDAEILTHFTQF